MVNKNVLGWEGLSHHCRNLSNSTCNYLIRGFTCGISTMWLLNVFLLERTLKQELQKWQPGTKGNLTIMPSCTPWLSWISSSALLFPSTSSSSSLSSLFSSPSSSFSHYFRRFEKPPGPTSSPTGTCRHWCTAAFWVKDFLHIGTCNSIRQLF